MGFLRSARKMSSEAGSALLIFYSLDIENTLEKIKEAKGSISKPTTYFPGGRRFHFLDPNGNEFAVWSDHEADGTHHQRHNPGAEVEAGGSQR